MTYLDAESFLDGMYAARADVFAAVDVWASHPYPMGPLAEGPWQQAFQIDLLNGARNPHHLEPPGRHVQSRRERLRMGTVQAQELRGEPAPSDDHGDGLAASRKHRSRRQPIMAARGRTLRRWPSSSIWRSTVIEGATPSGRRPAGRRGWTMRAWLRSRPLRSTALPQEWGHTNWLALDAQGQVLATYAPFDLLATGAAPP